MLAQTSWEVAPLIIGVILVFILIRLVAGNVDGDRIRAYIEERGGKLLESHWAPLGKGWLGEKNDRIYEIIYLDREGNFHQASCKTSMWSGVYFTEDTIVSHAESNMPEFAETELIDENRRLKAELERIKRQQQS